MCIVNLDALRYMHLDFISEKWFKIWFKALAKLIRLNMLIE